MDSYNTDYIIHSKNGVNEIIIYTGVIVGILLLTGFVGFIMFKIKDKKNAIRKEDRLKFIDVMTSLKNRNYLNYNIYLFHNHQDLKCL